MTSRRRDRKFQGRFHPDGPEDLQAVAHEVHPAVSGRAAQAVRVPVTGIEGDGFQVPEQAPPTSRGVDGAEILFIVMATKASRQMVKRAALSSVYRLVAGGLVVYGLWHVAVGTWQARPFGAGGEPGFASIFSGLDALMGFGVALLGAVNLLNFLHGPTAKGVRATAIAGNVLLVVLVAWIGGTPDDWVGYLLPALLVVAAGLSMSRRALSSKIAAV